MGLLLKLTADALRSHAGVVADARRELETELRPFATGPFSLELYQLAEARSGNAGLGGVTAHTDRALYGVVPTRLGPLEVALPFSAKDTMSPQFSLPLALGTPLALKLERDVFGSWGSGDWAALDPRSPKPGEHLLVQALKAARVGSSIEWNSQLAGRYQVKIGWGVLLVPGAGGKARVVVQNGVSGTMLRSFGVKQVFKTLEAVAQVLERPDLVALPPAKEAQSHALIDSMRELVARGQRPVAPAAARAPVSSETRERDSIDTRALWSVILGVMSIPMVMCVPMTVVSAWLGWSSRKKALALGRPVPKTAIAGLALSACSALLLLGMIAVAMLVPTQTSAEAAQHQRPTSASRSKMRVDDEPKPEKRTVALESRPDPAAKPSTAKKPRAPSH